MNKSPLHNKLVFILLFLLPFSLFANGGGIYYYGVNSAGNPYFKDVPDVQILREDLLIYLIGDRIEVKVTYLLHNTLSSSMNNLEYAFPVDYWCKVDPSNYHLPFQPEKGRNKNIQNIEFTCNQKKLSHQTLTPQVVSESSSFKMRTWYFTKLNLPKGITQLTVSYTLTSEYIYESGDLFKYATFNYDFTPAATFGNGIIKEFSMMIDASDWTIQMGQDLTDKTDRYSFKKEGNVYTYTESDFNLKDAEPLTILFEHEGQNASLLLTRCIPLSDLGIQVSSGTSSYPLSNILDMDFSSTWISEKKADSEWIEFTPRNKFCIDGIFLLPGYYKSEETYRNNNRIKKIFVEFFSKKGEILSSDTVEFKDKPYLKLNYSNFYNELATAFSYNYEYADFEVVDNNGNLVTGKIRITILDVYKGEKFNDTCISEIFVTGDYLK